MVAVSILPHADFGPNVHWEDASHFIITSLDHFQKWFQYLAPEILLKKHPKYWLVVSWCCNIRNGVWASSILLHPRRRNVSRDPSQTPLKLKSTVSVEMRSFLSKILEKNPENRLGHAPDGWQQIQNHSFFRQINFSDLLLKKYRPDFIPAVVSLLVFSRNWQVIFSGSCRKMFRENDFTIIEKKSQMMIVLNGYLTSKVWLEKHYTKRYYPDDVIIFPKKIYSILIGQWLFLH